MKKIDILNFITNFRKEPNDIKTYVEIKNHLRVEQDDPLLHMLEEMKGMRTLREVEKNGERAYQVAAK
jgi:Asp-tRNA(Asn)/Glu-tRNA(Gln) amidotransferase C subunit